jgi:iron complex outermembrane receptor protein
VNAALLFGRQKAQTHHQTTAQYHPHSGFFPGTRPVERTTLYQNPATPDHMRIKSVIVPNIGAFAGLSFRYAAAKVSFGYRADLFFNAMDGGIDTANKENVGFYGPFASVSVGLGG